MTRSLIIPFLLILLTSSCTFVEQQSSNTQDSVVSKRAKLNAQEEALALFIQSDKSGASSGAEEPDHTLIVTDFDATGQLAKPTAEEEAARLLAKQKAEEEAARQFAKQKAGKEAARLLAKPTAEEEAARQFANSKAGKEAARQFAKQKAEEEATHLNNILLWQNIWQLAKPKAELAKQRAEEEAARQVAKQRAEEEAARLLAKQRAEEEAARQLAKRKAEEEAARQLAKRKAEEEAARQVAKRKAEEEAARLLAKQRAEEEAARQLAKRKAEEEAAGQLAKRKAEQEAARQLAKRKAEEKAAGQLAKQEAEQEAARQLAKQEAEQEAARQLAKRKAEEEVAGQLAKRKAEEEAPALLIQSNKSGALIGAEQFAKDSAATIERTVATGPVIDSIDSSSSPLKKREQISRQEPKNYMDLDEQREDLFPITINLDRVDIRDAMTMLSEVTGKNILVGDEVSGTISVRLVNVPWNKALDAILQIRKLAKHVNEEGTIIRIHNQAALIAQEAFERQRREDLINSLEALEAIGPLYTEIFRLYYTEPEVVKTEIQEVLGISEEGSGGAYSVQIAIDQRIKALIIKGNRQDLDGISQLISIIDVRTKQVLIEAFIVEATDDFSKEFGSRLGISDVGILSSPSNTTARTTVTTGGVAGTQPATPGDLKLGDLTGLVTNFAIPGAAGIGVMVKSASTVLKATLFAMEKQGFSKIISNPRVFTLDNHEAIIIQGDEIPYQVDSGDGTTSVQFKNAGIKLTVTPSIVGDGNIILEVSIEKKSANTSTQNPPITTRSITTKLLIRDNTVVVIGGVFTQEISDGENKVPLLGDLPVIRHLFRLKSDKNVRKELLVFLAPRII